MPLVIYSLGRGHTRTHMNMHTDDPHRINFKKPGARRPAASAPVLKCEEVYFVHMAPIFSCLGHIWWLTSIKICTVANLHHLTYLVITLHALTLVCFVIISNIF